MKKTIVLYSDEKYYHHVVNTIESFRRVDEEFNFLFFQVGFDIPVFVYDLNIKCVRIEKENDLPSIILMKPTILKMSLSYCSNFIYIDCDALVSKNFQYDDLIDRVENFPIGPRLHETEWQYPFYHWTDGKNNFESNETELMKFMGVQERSQPWTSTLFLAVNEKCMDFILEWEKVCLDRSLWKGFECETVKIIPSEMSHMIYFHMGDEGPYNVLLWKKNIKNFFYENVVIEPKELLSFLIVENLKIKNIRLEPNNALTDVENSEKIYVFHQLKDLKFRIKILEELYAQNHR